MANLATLSPAQAYRAARAARVPMCTLPILRLAVPTFCYPTTVALAIACAAIVARTGGM
jgi:hypothetical protein